MNNRLFLTVILSTVILSLSFAQGSRYSGPYVSSTPISWNGVKNQTISGLEIENPNGHCIELINCSNITIENCKLGPSLNEGVNLYKCTNIVVTNCTMDNNDTGVYAGACSGINVMFNDVINVQGPLPRGQMVQFAEVTGGGNSVSYNVVENILGESHPEDAISLFKSNGIAGSPIRIVGNWIRGGGPSDSGGGIMTGDMGGSYILVEDNVLVNPGQYGITIASGTNIAIKNNKIYGKRQEFSNIGLSAYKQYQIDTHSDTIMQNQVNFRYMDGQLNNLLNDGKCGTIYGWETNAYNPILNENILPAKIIGRATIQGVATETVPLPAVKEIKIYPNPASDHLTIESSAELNHGFITIYNISGQKMIDEALNVSSTEINTTNLAVGVYLVKVMDNNELIEQKKIMIRK